MLTTAQAWDILARVPDPEIPVVTLADLGILRGVDEDAGEAVVRLSPTYSGCPATAAIEMSVASALAEAGIPARVERRLVDSSGGVRPGDPGGEVVAELETGRKRRSKARCLERIDRNFEGARLVRCHRRERLPESCR